MASDYSDCQFNAFFWESTQSCLSQRGLAILSSPSFCQLFWMLFLRLRLLRNYILIGNKQCSFLILVKGGETRNAVLDCPSQIMIGCALGLAVLPFAAKAKENQRQLEGTGSFDGEVPSSKNPAVPRSTGDLIRACLNERERKNVGACEITDG